MVGSGVGPGFGTAFDPMLSAKTSFDRVLDDISSKHREYYARELRPQGRWQTPPLAFQHPAFSVETKLDGDRMLLHVGRDGRVQIHSRRSVWYR